LHEFSEKAAVISTAVNNLVVVAFTLYSLSYVCLLLTLTAPQTKLFQKMYRNTLRKRIYKVPFVGMLRRHKSGIVLQAHS
jgi:hypothetical protein